MPSLTPSPPLSASSTRRGLVDTVAQTFAGVKTFLAAAVFSAGVQLSLLFGTNGGSAADVTIKAGTTLADASTAAGAKFFSVRTGLGGTEVEKFAVTKTGIDLFQGAEINFRDVWGLRIYAQSGYIYLNGPAWCASMIASQGLLAPNWNNAGPLIAYRVDGLAGASDVSMKVGTSVADATVNASHKLLTVRTGLGGTEVESFAFFKGGIASGADANSILRLDGTIGAAIEYSNGRLAVNSVGIAGVANGADGSTAFSINTWFSWTSAASRLASLSNQGSTRWQIGPVGNAFQWGTDSTGTPGAVTASKPIGKAAIAVGASSVVITNSLVTAASHVVITAHARDATCKELIAVPGAGIITVSGSANATAALPFSWEVKGLL